VQTTDEPADKIIEFKHMTPLLHEKPYDLDIIHVKDWNSHLG